MKKETEEKIGTILNVIFCALTFALFISVFVAIFV